MVIHFSFAVWLHSFRVLPAVGFKARHTDVKYGKKTTLDKPPCGTSDISTHCVGYIQYRADPKLEAVVVVGEIQLNT